jgi:hypothetical protein
VLTQRGALDPGGDQEEAFVAVLALGSAATAGLLIEGKGEAVKFGEARRAEGKTAPVQRGGGNVQKAHLRL